MLVADDSPTSLSLVSGVLEQRGYVVVSARDGLEAMEAVYREWPDVVLLDVVMPRMNGFQVCRMLKLDEDTRHLPVVMLTSKDLPADQYWGLQTGADAYVTKEQPIEMVLETVDRILAGRDGNGMAHRRRGKGRVLSPIEVLSRLSEILDRKLYEATILGEVSKLAWSAKDLEQTTREIMALLGKLFGFRVACMVVPTDEARQGETIWMVRTSLSQETLRGCEQELSALLLERGAVPDGGAGLRRRLVLAPGAVLTDGEPGGEPLGRFLAVPLGSGEYQKGLLGLWGGEKGIDSPESLRIVQMVANAAYVVLENARLYQELARLASTDGLTGLANYRKFQEELEKEFQRSRRTGEPLSLLMIDLDDFKAINDTFGHKMGDQVLQAVASSFAGNARQYDLVARYGGEEFAVILPATDSGGAVEMGERLRLLVRAVAGRMKLQRLSASVGVASYPHPSITDAQGLVVEADSALYSAKAEGKDRVRVSAA